MYLSVISVPAFSQGMDIIHNFMNTEEWNTDLLFYGIRKYFGYFQIFTSAKNDGMNNSYQTWKLNLLSCNLHFPEYGIKVHCLFICFVML